MGARVATLSEVYDKERKQKKRFKLQAEEQRKMAAHWHREAEKWEKCASDAKAALETRSPAQQAHARIVGDVVDEPTAGVLMRGWDGNRQPGCPAGIKSGRKALPTPSKAKPRKETPDIGLGGEMFKESDINL